MSSEVSTLALKMPSSGRGRFSGKDHKLHHRVTVKSLTIKLLTVKSLTVELLTVKSLTVELLTVKTFTVKSRVYMLMALIGRWLTTLITRRCWSS